jgi:hypothetical protein
MAAKQSGGQAALRAAQPIRKKLFALDLKIYKAHALALALARSPRTLFSHQACFVVLMAIGSSRTGN